MGALWAFHERSVGVPWVFHERSMGAPWAFHGRSMGVPWALHGRSMSASSVIVERVGRLYSQMRTLVVTSSP